MNSIEAAIAWEVGQRHRLKLIGFGAWLAGAWCWHRWLLQTGRGGAAEILAYAVLIAGLFGTFGCFHFTEGKRRGGFGSFPARLFHLPVRTRRLVLLPMAYGAVAVVLVYLGLSAAFLAPLGKMPPLVWPSLYLACGLALFQMVIWSFPESRYLKLCLMCGLGMGIALGWMFFLPHVLEGTLAELGYTGSPRIFRRWLFAGVGALLPAAFVFSTHRVNRQRHGVVTRLAIAPKAASLSKASRGVAERPWVTPERALFWHEWRQTGLLLPVAVMAVLLLVGGPVCLSGDLGPSATWALVMGVLSAPVLLAAVLGTGYCKPDFWREDLKVSSFYAARPWTAGAWVIAKLKVAGVSVFIAWALATVGLFLCLAWAGDFQELERLWRVLRHSDAGRWGGLVVILVGLWGMTLSWRMLVWHLWAGLSGRKWRYWLVSGTLAMALLSLFLWMVLGDGPEGRRVHLYEAWGVIESLPFLLPAWVGVRVVVAAIAWRKVVAGGMLPVKTLNLALLVWGGLTGLLLLLPTLAFPEIAWLRSLLQLGALLWVPLASPALGILAFAGNRYSP